MNLLKDFMRGNFFDPPPQYETISDTERERRYFLPPDLVPRSMDLKCFKLSIVKADIYFERLRTLKF